MLLVLTWPRMSQQLQLDESVTHDKPVCFNIENGEFTPHSMGDGHDEVQFYWDVSQPMMVNHSHDMLCTINGTQLAPGEHHPLTLEAEIKFGYFVITTKQASQDANSNQFIDNLTLLEQPSAFDAPEVPAIEDILTHGGYYVSYLDDLHADHVYGPQGPDILKSLELEYKRFLMWGEQGKPFSGSTAPQKSPLLANDGFLENVRDNVKNKTVTECILDSTGLIDKVTRQLNVIDGVEESAHEERQDILKALAPEHILTKEQNSVPALVFQELYKLGLNSHL